MSDNTRRSITLAAALVFVLVFGTLGYCYLEEGWNLTDALYMTVITITTVGFGETHELTSTGRWFTIVVIGLGWSVLMLFASHAARIVIESEVRGIFGKKKMFRRILNMENHYVVCGFGRIGGSICSDLAEKGLPFVVIEKKEELAAQAEEKDYCIIRGDATSDSVLKQAGVESAAGVVAALSADKDNLFISLAARELNPKMLIISRGEEPGVEDRILRAGADIVVSPMKLGGQQIAKLILQQMESSSASADGEEGLASVLGFSLRIFRHTGDDITTVARVAERAGALSVAAIKHEDGSMEIDPAPAMEVSSSDSLVLFVKDKPGEQKAIAPELDDRKILLADDHKALRHLFARKIRSAGYELVTAADGLEALQLAQEHTPDLMVLDVVMPEMNGYEVCEAVRAMPRHKDTPIILFSATDTAEFTSRGQEAGATACLRKTSKSSELLAKIEELLEPVPQAPAPEAPVSTEAAAALDMEAAPNVDPSGILDQSRLLELTDNDIEAIREVIGDLLSETPLHLERLEKAIADGDGENARREAHGIKGAAANIGCIEVQAIAAKIEDLGRRGEVGACADMLPALTAAHERLKAELRRIGWDPSA
ncbi:MAG: response regulator [Nitrospiraceae bacterium]|nr:response regulator [Nitrospiraceae bacterium]